MMFIVARELLNVSEQHLIPTYRDAEPRIGSVRFVVRITSPLRLSLSPEGWTSCGGQGEWLVA
jgi:hypothetical protein